VSAGELIVLALVAYLLAWSAAAYLSLRHEESS